MPSSLARGIWLLLYICAIYALSSVPDTEEAVNIGSALLRQLPPDLQNLLHIPLFGMLTWLCHRTLRPLPPARAAAWTLILVLTYAAADELHQSTTLGRVASLDDWLLDACGALLALVIAWLRSRSLSPTNPAAVK